MSALLATAIKEMLTEVGANAQLATASACPGESSVQSSTEEMGLVDVCRKLVFIALITNRMCAAYYFRSSPRSWQLPSHKSLISRDSRQRFSQSSPGLEFGYSVYRSTSSILRCADHIDQRETILLEDDKASTSIHSPPSNTSPSVASVFTIASIVALVVQNSGLALTMRLSRVNNKDNMYSASTAVLVSEIIKFIISLVAYRWTNPTNRRVVSLQEMLGDVPMLGEVSIPSAMYVLQNNLQYIAMSSLPAAVYQVLVQMKIITAAILSQLYLKRKIANRQWLAIVALTLGVVVVQLSMASKAPTVANLNLPLGLMAVGLSCFTSGYAGVKLESTLKDSRESLWVRNVQIAIVSMAIAACACIKDGGIIMRRGFFHGYTPLVWMVILIQAVGGILVSLVVKHTSTIVKGFATAASIILTSIVSAALLQDVKINSTFLIGTFIVCMSTIAYSVKPAKLKDP